MPLRDYIRKRKFSATPEPAGRPAAKPVSKNRLFVIQKHAARRLHYDLRFEAGGVLKSWAVPKGLPLKKGERHLAIHVEDHPRDYATFEGVIPQGNYGAGSVMVWDIGQYDVEGGDFEKALRKGHIHFTLHGKKLKGDWSLVRMHKADEKDQWLVLKHGTDLKELSARTEDSSALSHRGMKKIAGSTAGKKGPRESPHFIPPMKALLVEDPPQGGEWLHEIKFDGMRILAVKNGRDLALFSRTHRDVTDHFPSLASELKKLTCRQAVLDGEIVALDEHGISSFQLLQPYMQGIQEESGPLYFYLFDLLHSEGRNVRDQPIEHRKQLLKSLLETAGDRLRLSDNLPGDLSSLIAEARRRGLEGIIAKRSGSRYEPDRRSGSWLKLKTQQEQEFVIGGYTAPQGGREHFGALLLGYYDKDKLRFASKVGTGFDTATLKSLYQKFEKLRQPVSPFVNKTRDEGGRCTWLKPKLVCEIRFREWTGGAGLRQPVFLGLRNDKRPGEVRREKPSRQPLS